jgi:hypothetical protein
MGARLPLRLLRGLSSSFDSAFVLMSRAYGGMKRSSRGLLLILADFCASFYGGARGRKRPRFAPRLSQVAASDFAVRHSLVEAIRRFRRTSPRCPHFGIPRRFFNRLLGDDLRLRQPPIFARRNTDLSAEDSSEMARAGVTNIESYLDYAPVGLPQQTAGLLQS